MREFFKTMGSYFAPYKKYMFATLGLNILTAIFNVFTFTLLLPILNILFKIDQIHYEYIPWGEGDLKETATNNLYYFSQQLIEKYGEPTTLLLLGLGLFLLRRLR